MRERCFSESIARQSREEKRRVTGLNWRREKFGSRVRFGLPMIETRVERIVTLSRRIFVTNLIYLSSMDVEPNGIPINDIIPVIKREQLKGLFVIIVN